ncbi:MAG: FKBP-type peptidyl-prolyl cis-trans isomerase [Candidatus Porifericomitaceae bacterium WSBS_2022_MAG_OTU9]
MILVARGGIPTLLFLLSALSLVTTGVVHAADGNDTGTAQNTSYALGMQFADNVLSMLPQWPIDSKSFSAGVRDALSGNKLSLSGDEISHQLQKIRGKGNGAPPSGLDPENFSYALGAFTSRQLTIDIEGLPMRYFYAGIRDMVDGVAPMLKDDEASKYLQAYFSKLDKERERLAAKNRKHNKEFFAANGSRSGVKTHSSGLQYIILHPGKGTRPKPGAQVSVHYVGTLLDGTEFDSSRKNEGAPVSFSLGQVIKGWQMALPMMRTGALWRLWLPPELAYGKQGAPPSIGPDQALIFEIELIAATGH